MKILVEFDLPETGEYDPAAGPIADQLRTDLQALLYEHGAGSTRAAMAGEFRILDA